MENLDQYGENTKEAFLHISCDGERGHITCHATLCWHNHNDLGFSYIMFEDFSQRLGMVKARATQKNIDALYNEHSTNPNAMALMERVTAHYVEAATAAA